MGRDICLKSLCLRYFVTAGTGNSCDFGQLCRAMPAPRASLGVAEASVATILQAGFSLCGPAGHGPAIPGGQASSGFL